MNENKIIQSEITLSNAIEDVEIFAPCKIIFNDIVIYNDYDSTDVIDVLDDGTKVYGEIYPSRFIVPNRIVKFKYSIVVLYYLSFLVVLY